MTKHRDLDEIGFVSLMADNADFVYQAIAGYLEQHIGVPVRFYGHLPWQCQEQILDRGKAQMGVICGLPYIRKVDRPRPLVKLLVAPIMEGRRYQNRPIYFSDVVVRADSPFRSFEDLKGASWSYNETGSQSGYNLTRYNLAIRDEGGNYFSRIVEAGSHQNSLRFIVDGEVDASAIDTTVLEMELQQCPQLASQIRVIHTFGPSPIPPFVVLRSVPDHFTHELRKLLLHMHRDRMGMEILKTGRILRFSVVRDRDYDAIRKMSEVAKIVKWNNATFSGER